MADLESFPTPTEKMVLLGVNGIKDNPTIEDIRIRVQGDWRLSLRKAKQAKYAVAVLRGVAIGIFRITSKWQVPSKSYDTIRYCFESEEANPEIWERYIGENGKRITDTKRIPTQNPVRYWNID